ncbi:MAG: hypothetical protein FVQ82_03300 [Planctomycetes bacterium]|nr:hypothetical protein [Planctomycetota bacterium]
MKTSAFSIMIAVLICVFSSSLCWAYPEPTVAGGINDWNMDVEFGKPQQISVKLPGDAKGAPGRRFWYVILSVKNDTGSDVDYYPSCDLMTDTFKVTPAGKDVMGVVFEKIKLVQKSRFPFLERFELVANRILQGEDNAKDIVVIWPDFDDKAKNVDLFIGGLSNETVAIEHPTKKDKDGKAVKVYLQKTLQLKYTIGGDKKFRSESKLKYRSKRWIMR